MLSLVAIGIVVVDMFLVAEKQDSTYSLKSAITGISKVLRMKVHGMLY